ncbi:MAG: hypothetical protein J6Q69_05485 [Clostridia bacterium]|nr:hypothetical protein [Clostridia bacterium]
MKIAEIDKNFNVATNIMREGMVFYNVNATPFSIHGVYYDDGKYRRLPESVAKTVSKGVYELHAHTAGGRVRFKTNSPYVAIHSVMTNAYKMPHFPFSGSCGFDLYVDGNFIKSFVPPYEIETGYDSILETGSTEMHDILINFPLYSDVCELYVGLDEKAEIKAPDPYINELPVIYYGSSITQGGCASRPGATYQAFVSRALNLDYISLGFSGNAKAEDEIADYIADLKMSVFVYDYDHNAPSNEHYKATHEKMFLKVREKNPDLPIIIMPRPNVRLGEIAVVRRRIAKRTYNNAIKRGDKNVYFIDGRELMALCGDEATVDFTHPTDLGFYSMSLAVGKKLKKILGIK